MLLVVCGRDGLVLWSLDGDLRRGLVHDYARGGLGLVEVALDVLVGLEAGGGDAHHL